MKSLKTRLAAASCLLAMLGHAPSAAAQTTEDVGVEILQLLVEEGVIPAEKANAILGRAREAAAMRKQAEAPAGAGTVDVPYIPEVVRLQIRDEIKQEVMAEAKTQGWVAPNSLPGWVSRISLDGDFRLRYQGEYFDDGNFPLFPDVGAINRSGGVTTADGFPLLNTTENRHRLRYRARLGLKAKLTDQVLVGVRLASGNDAGAVSTNETMGDYFEKDAIWIDRAYVQVTPFEGVSLIGGRMPNPFFSTDLVWDTDVNPEGVALSLGYDGFSEMPFAPRPFLVAGAFPLVERGIDDNDRWLYAGQVGLEAEPMDDLSVKVAATYYDFQNVQSRLNPPDGSRLNDFTAPPALSNGNSVFNIRTDGLTTLAGLASKYELLNLTGQLTYRGFDPIMVRLTGDYVKNLAFDKGEIDRLRGEAGVPPGDTGWQARVTVGHEQVKQRNEWQVSAGFKRLETDAVMDIFTDSDFGLGGTDVEGYVLEAVYGVYDNTSISLNWFSTNSIDRPPLGVDVLQLNLNTQF
jgi:hypothetical protein